MVFHFCVFLCILLVRDDSSVRVSRFYKKVKNCFRGNGGSRWYFLQKKIRFLQDEMQKFRCLFQKTTKKTLFSATSVQSLCKAIEQKSDTKKACFLLFFSNFFQIFLTTLHFKSRSFSLFFVFRHNNLLNLNPESLRNPEN